MTPIDASWRAAHPLPAIGDGLDKNARGKVLLVGGSAFVPGALRLTGEAALRAGAGKVQLATIDTAAIALGIAFPEAAVIALPADKHGEIAAEAHKRIEPRLDSCDTLVIGPGMMPRPHTAMLVKALLARHGPDASTLLDAGALTAMHGEEDAIRSLAGQIVMTPHPGELAALTGFDKSRIERDPEAAVCVAAARFGAVIALKSTETLIADGAGGLLRYAGGSPGLGTAGSGDVLAGIIAGLLARGATPLVATAWGVWLHGEAGALLSRKMGSLGFLARDLAAFVPALMDQG
ncbi:NAD(P)H-hydrate dehydratase [Sphingomonas sp. So64.6b]|nr:NAD(P)H-hydrate dehydratase [Sphingomonas sp. So64.6b]